MTIVVNYQNIAPSTRCHRRIRYATRAEAIEMREAAGQRYGRYDEVRECETCGGWHLHNQKVRGSK